MTNRSVKHTSIANVLTTLAQDGEDIKMVANRGYVIAPQKILRCFRLSDFEKILLLELVSYMGANNYAFPSHRYLAFKTGKKSTATIKTTLKSLRDKGFIYWSKGGGDLGTNHYRVGDLHANPYIIMSEFTHFFVNEVLAKHRSEITYEDIYLTVQNIIETPKVQQQNNDDPYGRCIEYLFKDPTTRDSIDMYWLFGNILKYNIEVQSNIAIKFDCYNLVVNHFEENHPFLILDLDMDHPIHEVLEDPYLKKPIEVVAEGINSEQEAFLIEYRKRIQEYVDSLDEKQILQKILHDIIMVNPGAFFGTAKDQYNEFNRVKDNEDECLSFVKKISPSDPKYFLIGILMSSKVFEIRGDYEKLDKL